MNDSAQDEGMTTDKIQRPLTEEEKDLLGLGWRSDAAIVLSPDEDALRDAKATVEATLVGEMKLRIREGKVVGLVLIPYEGDAGYFGPKTTPNGAPERDGGDIPNAAYDMAVDCIDSGFQFPDDGDFPPWVEWVA